VPAHPEIRVWNLSIGGSKTCSNHAFSDFAIALDDLQTKHAVTFVLAAGNYNEPPYRAWPTSGSLGDSDRICAPADSARALTVGSIAHRDSPNARVRASSPSPFSRRGPGPVHLPKPEISHFGGNCDPTGAHAQIGVLSVDANGNLAESIGTSFGTPIASAIVAHVQARPSQPLSCLMAKALVVHSAALATPDLRHTDLPYTGYGVPSDIATILDCEPWAPTLMFEFEIKAGLDLQRWPFPLPACLLSNNGRSFRGEMTITLAYEAPLDGSFGAEYCRSNINVSLGTYVTDAAGDRAQKRQVHPFPKRGKVSAREKALVEHGLKWSPIKVYRRVIPRGVGGDTWRMTVDATDRSGAQNVPIRVALVLTIADPEQQAPVYNDLVQAMNKLGWVTSDISIRERARYRAV